MIFLIVVAVSVVGWLGWYVSHRRPVASQPPVSAYEPLLEQYVPYYRQLSDEKKQSFADRVAQFLNHIDIQGVGTTVDERDKVLVASSAIIPIFGFDGWDYYRLTTVLLYEDSFNAEYETTGNDRNILGMVGDGGALKSTMALSQRALRAGFANQSDTNNTGIHEFVHLLDKADGATDGLPELMLDLNQVKPWLQLIHRSINEIKANRSDINPYGITNEAEFFAVVSEYFFKQPALLHQKHPELFARLEEIFRQHPANPAP